MIPTSHDRSWQGYDAGAPGEAQVQDEAEHFPDRMELWSCEGTRRFPHEMTINKTRRSRCRVCGFDRRHRFADEERVVMA
jgi:hypothetical protein